MGVINRGRGRPAWQRVRRRSGLLAGEDRRGGWLRHWREPYLLALSMSWPAFLLLVALVYVGINLLFAGLYRLDPQGIAGGGAEGVSAVQAFFFSVQTLGSIGYGVLHPVSLYANVVVTVESLSGLLFIALTTGLAFARFARSTARIRFSRLAVVHPYNGQPILAFRLANERRNGLLEARLRLYLAVDEVSSEGHRMRRLRPLVLERDQGIAFLLIWTAMHRIDAESPLHGLRAEELRRLNAELVVSFAGLDETLERPVHARASWPLDRIAFGRCFVDMVEDEPAAMRINWEAFDQTVPCVLPPT
jgi:inward rectifier potassium channel